MPAVPFHPKRIACTCLCGLLAGLLLLSPRVRAAQYDLPSPGNDLVGEMQWVQVKGEETLLDIARRFDLGFNEIVAANPDVDPWLPRPGDRIVVPTRFVLPHRPWEGIVVNLAEMRLYYFPEAKAGQPAQVITHPIGIGQKNSATPLGKYSVVLKIEKPNWTMPDSVYEEYVAEGIHPRRVIPPGAKNPLGEFAMKLDAEGLFIHGTNKPFSVGMQVSRGCIRLYPEDIRSLVYQVPNGTSVRVEEDAYKLGMENGVLFLEAHKPIKRQEDKEGQNLTPVISGVVKAGVGRLSDSEWDRILAEAERHTGIPTPIVGGKVVLAPRLP
jgi:L,D-transpeptidase ErfK/SrfK